MNRLSTFFILPRVIATRCMLFHAWQHGKIDELLRVEIGGDRSFLAQEI